MIHVHPSVGPITRNMVIETGESIPPILQCAKTLRQVRRMQRKFMMLWALDALAARAKQSQGAETDTDAWVDPKNHNWKVLYRGSVLDD